MKSTINELKRILAGQWSGEGFAKFPTIDDTAYNEELEFIPDQWKDAIYYSQHTWYKNETEKNGQTVFWDAGFIILKEEKILMNSVQIGGRMEVLELVNVDLAQHINAGQYIFNSQSIQNDAKTIRSQRILSINGDLLHYELNMATHAADFQNHLSSDLRRVTFKK